MPNFPTNKRRALHTGSDPNRPTLVAIKGTVFDVTRNAAYGAAGQYRGESLMRLVDADCAPTGLQ
jgi:cytochrome b involved in lipid metabolism